MFVFFILVIAFFWKVFFRNLIPFPGDMLVGAYYPWYFRIPIKNPLISDVFSGGYQYRVFLVESIKNHFIPLWNPYSYSGQPFLATYGSNVFNPFMYLMLLLGHINGWSAMIIFQTLGSLITMYFFLLSLNNSKKSSIFGSIIYAFSGFAICWSQFTLVGYAMVWLPLILLLINKKQFKFLPIVYFLLMSAGHTQSLIFGLTFSSAYYFYKYKLKYIFPFLIYSFIGVLLMSIQLLPSWELAKLSIRFHEKYIADYNFGLLPFENLITLFAPDYFGNPTTNNYFGVFNYFETVIYCGVISFFILISEIINFKKIKNNLFFLISTIISLLLIFNNPVSRLIYLLKIPILSGSSAGRLVFIFTFSIAVLAANWLEDFKYSKFKTIFLNYWSIILIFLTSFLITYFLKLSVSLRNLILPGFLISSIFLILLFIKNKAIATFLIIFLTIFDLFRFGWKFTPFTSKKYVYPQNPITDFILKQPGIFRIDRENSAILPPDTWTAFGLMSPSGYNPLAPYEYVLNYSKNFNHSTFISRYSVQDYIDSKQLGEYNVKYFLIIKENKKNHDNPPGFKQVFEYNNTLILENLDYKPRTETINSSPVEIIHYSPNKVTINFDTPTDTKLILRDTYYPGWIAKINNIETPIFKHKDIYRQIELPKGSGTVEFIYQPKSFKIGMYATFIGIILWIIIFFLL